MINDFINNLVPSLEHLRVGGYWLAFFAAFLETTIVIGLFLPGSTIILILGTLAARGSLDLGDLIWFAVMGAILGDNLNYSLGRKYGAKWLERGFWFLKTQHIEKARSFMDVHGAKSVFLGRFIPSVKEIVPFIAGSVRMRKKTFLLWNVLGAIGWGLQWVLAGYVFAHSLGVAELWLSRTGLFFALVLAFSVLVYLLKRVIVARGKPFLAVAASLAASFKQGFLQNEYVARWRREHPRTILFLQARLDTSTFTGLPLTILVSALVYVLALFGGIVEDVVTADPIVAVDIHIANILTVFRTELLTAIFSWITLLGKWQVVVVFIAVSAGVLWLWRRSVFILPLLLAVIGSETFTFLGKLAFHRQRPALAVYTEHSFSFPSGHATVAIAFYGFLGYLLIRFSRDWRRRVNLFFAVGIVVLAIGLSRIYLGVHFLSDVWSGFLVGAMWLITAITLAEWRTSADSGERKAPLPAARPLSITLAVAAIAFYTGFALRYQPEPAAAPVHKVAVVSDAVDIFTRQQLKYTETLFGEKQEPINFIFMAKDDHQLVRALEQAGLHPADRIGFSSLIKTVQAVIANTPYPSAPVSPSFWNARVQDFSFTEPAGPQPFGHAHHARVWRTNARTEKEERIYVGLATATGGVKWGVMPEISPNVDAERELLLAALNRSVSGIRYRKVRLVEPQTGKNFSGDQFFTDGMAYVISLP